MKITASFLDVYCVSWMRYYYFPQYTEKEADVQRCEMTDIKPLASKVKTEIYFWQLFFIAVKYTYYKIYHLNHFLSICVLSCFSRVQLLATSSVHRDSPWGFSRQEYWSGLLSSIPGDLPDLGLKLTSTCISCICRWIL